MDPSNNLEVWFCSTRIRLESCQREYILRFRNLVLECLGFPVYHKLLSSISPRNPEDVPLDTLMALTREIKVSEREKLYETATHRRFFFHKRTQKESESFREYHNSLKELIPGCEYGPSENEQLRDQLIFGLKDVIIQAFALENCGRVLRSEDVVTILEAKFNPRVFLPLGEGDANVNVPLCKNEIEQVAEDVGIGIEGNGNSCYMDASLMGVFMYETSFNECLNNSEHETADKLQNEIRHVLKNEVVLPLQRHGKLSLASGAMAKFRELMSHISYGFHGDQMDAEEFLTTLFGRCLHSKDFYKIDGNGAGFVLQTFGDETAHTGRTTVKHLLDSTFRISEVHLDEVPKPGFILKMPVSNGKATFKHILPNLEISLGNILLEKGANQKMLLSAVICLEENHYTVFARQGRGKDAPWIFLDSFNYPNVTVIPELGRVLTDIEKDGKSSVSGISKVKIVHLLSSAYMCIYVRHE